MVAHESTFYAPFGDQFVGEKIMARHIQTHLQKPIFWPCVSLQSLKDSDSSSGELLKCNSFDGSTLHVPALFSPWTTMALTIMANERG